MDLKPTIGRPRSRRPLHGFTLVELLVVISIIALLIALLLPALTQAHRRAADMQCMFNMHQCHIALNAYAADCKNYPPNTIHDGVQFWQGINTATATAPVGVGAALLMVEGGYLPLDFPSYNDSNPGYNDPLHRASKVTFCSEFLRIGTPAGLTWYSGGGYLYAGGPGSYPVDLSVVTDPWDYYAAGFFQFNSSMVPDEPAWYFLSMTAAQARAGGVAVGEQGPLLACDAYGNWSTLVGIVHGADTAASTTSYPVHDPGIGYRNFLMNDGRIVQYNGGRGL